MTKVEQELRRRIENANFEEITIKMKSDGETLTISPCGYGDLNWNTAEYFLVYSAKLPWLGGDTIEKVAEQIANYDKLLEESASGVEKLKANIRKYGEDNDWDCVSDWHKDLFGHRPHVPHSQIIAWAHSDSIDSARYFVG